MKAQSTALLVLGSVALAFPNSTGVGVPHSAPPASTLAPQPPPTCAFPEVRPERLSAGKPGNLAVRPNPQRLTLDASGGGRFTVQTSQPGRVWFVLPRGLTLARQGEHFRLHNRGLGVGEHAVLVCAAGNGGGQALQTLRVQVLPPPQPPSEWVTPARLTLPPGGQASLRIRHGGGYRVGTAHGLATVHRTVSEREATVTLHQRGLPPGDYHLPLWLRAPSGNEVRTSVRLRALP